jgi:hypothetical protein
VKTLCSRLSVSRFSNATPVYEAGRRVKSVAPIGGGVASRLGPFVAGVPEQLAMMTQQAATSGRR